MRAQDDDRITQKIEQKKEKIMANARQQPRQDTDSATNNVETASEPVPVEALDDLLPEGREERDELARLCAAARSAKAKAADYEKIYRTFLTQIRAIVDRTTDFPARVLGDTWDLRRLDGESAQLSPERLLEYGVSMKVIEQATVRVPWTTFALYGVGGQKKKNGGGE